MSTSEIPRLGWLAAERSEAPGPSFLGHMLLACAFLTLAATGHGEDLDLKTIFQEGIPPSPFIGVVYRYADTMLQHGRDTHGPHKTGLLLGALDRKTLAPLEARPPAPQGVREESRPGPRDKPLLGANPQLDQNLLRLLLFLKGLSGDDRYPQAADEALKWFLENSPSPRTDLLPWGRHLSWEVMTDEVASGLEQPMHEFSRPWMLWDKCFQLAPQQSKRFALALWNRHVVDHKTGAVSRRADFDRPSSQPGEDSVRQAGFCIRTWAEAHAHTKDDTFLKAIDVVLTRYEGKLHSTTKPVGPDFGSEKTSAALSLAIDCDGAARKVPEPLRTRLTGLAADVDQAFCSLPHELGDKEGFATSFDSPAGKYDGTYTHLWRPSSDGQTTAAVAVMCVSRYENTGKIGYRNLIVAAADAYLDSLPAEDVDAWPMTFGHAISLQLAAFRATARRKYHGRAFRLGEIAIESFLGDNPLPRASLKSEHYESTTGADTLMLALTELHLSTLQITAVRAPVNTIDR